MNLKIYITVKKKVRFPFKFKKVPENLYNPINGKK